MRKMEQNEFNAIKLMLEKGASQKDAMTLFGISRSTVGRINASDNWESYQSQLAEEARKAKERYYRNKATKKVETQPSKKPVAEIVSFNDPAKTGSTQIVLTNYQMTRLLEKMEQQNEYLKMISAKLAFVVEQLA